MKPCCTSLPPSPPFCERGARLRSWQERSDTIVASLSRRVELTGCRRLFDYRKLSSRCINFVLARLTPATSRFQAPICSSPLSPSSLSLLHNHLVSHLISPTRETFSTSYPRCSPLYLMAAPTSPPKPASTAANSPSRSSITNGENTNAYEPGKPIVFYVSTPWYCFYSSHSTWFTDLFRSHLSRMTRSVASFVDVVSSSTAL